jgi:hypothetical protein
MAFKLHRLIIVQIVLGVLYVAIVALLFPAIFDMSRMSPAIFRENIESMSGNLQVLSFPGSIVIDPTARVVGFVFSFSLKTTPYKQISYFLGFYLTYLFLGTLNWYIVPVIIRSALAALKIKRGK